eukprot:CAMPEP_0201568552 /NCGR_PEP_ID=MMETSP0190_2-20130828/9688_1 /ASSEMBLY_ACC=CAM_ASM_000263 /TAXON_ID=37353 /ORGANISM="Rosalina sp." /LENGTH=130 /DNA_ID=CAMNT_0047989791 /DNA_START=78 /DNA_END=473 /DNA_ORIENTATION=-
MGNGNSNDSSSSESDTDIDDQITPNNVNKGIIDHDKTYESSKQSSSSSSGGITSGVKSMFGGIKNYFTGPTQSELEQLDKYENKYTNRAVFVKLSAPNYYFANQGLQWVQDTKIYDEEGDGYHISVGPLS